MNVQAKPKPFAWSYSKLKNFETCPRRYEEVDVKKGFDEGEQGKSPELRRGDELHEAMMCRVQGTTPLPPQFLYMERWAEKLSRELHWGQIIQCELKLSIDREGNSTGYFDKDTWLRTRIDYFRTVPGETPGHAQGHVVDYKTGKPPRVWDGTQLLINAHLIFCHYKHVETLRVDYLWTEYNDTTHETYTRGETPKAFEAILPRVAALENAHATGMFPPKPCGLCKDYCPVSTCEHYGKRMGRG
ncbi:MAG TPA: PD-(D/E)XK nuclease family protein [Nitrospiraceae bacterium]|nr:PD-(D/E)XK nuclease family protein [Nitrospiraceae bacterium]